jgi:hypothetical protein
MNSFISFNHGEDETEIKIAPKIAPIKPINETPPDIPCSTDEN